MNEQVLDEYEALTAGVGVAELERTLIEVSGKDRTHFLHSFCTADIKKLAAGRACEAFVTNHQGKIVGHVLVLNLDDSLLIDTVGGQADGLIAHFDRFVISEDVAFKDMSATKSDLLISGADAVALLERLSSQTPPAEMMAHTSAVIAGHKALIVRVEYAGPMSFFLQIDSSHAAEVFAAAEQAGARRCDHNAVEMARIEAGVPLFGREITEDNLPQEINRDAKAISFTKGCYLGQETVARIDALGHVNRVLAGLRFQDHAIPEPGTALTHDGKEIGRITSAAWSPKLSAPLSLALIRRTYSKPGETITTPIGPAEVVTLPP